jgi:hypothetical protein
VALQAVVQLGVALLALNTSGSDATGAKGSVLIVANPKGVPKQNLDFRPDAVIRLDPALFSH